MADTSHDIRILNGLIATVIDSAEGYAEAAKDSDGGRFTPIFTAARPNAATSPRPLQGEVVRLGGTAPRMTAPSSPPRTGCSSI